MKDHLLAPDSPVQRDVALERRQAIREQAEEVRVRSASIVQRARAAVDHAIAVCNAAPCTPEHAVIVCAASAGGLQALTTVLEGLPRTLPAAMIVVLHRNPCREDHLPEVLARHTSMPVRLAVAGEHIEDGVVYLARPDLHLTVTSAHRFAYGAGHRISGVLSAANPLFESAAAAFQARTFGVVLSGAGIDATDGVQAIKRHGGTVVAQDPRTATITSMPASAIGTGVVDQILPLEGIAPALLALIRCAADPVPA